MIRKLLEYFNPNHIFSLQIFLCGFSGRKLDKLRRLINSGGGVRFNQLNEDVTHVIMGDFEDDVRQFWSKSSHRSCQSLIQNALYWNDLGSIYMSEAVGRLGKWDNGPPSSFTLELACALFAGLM